MADPLGAAESISGDLVARPDDPDIECQVQADRLRLLVPAHLAESVRTSSSGRCEHNLDRRVQ